MDRLYRLRIRPLSPWRTLWQSDTITGMLCWMCVRAKGKETLQDIILEPAMQGNPPFVISDAFPHDCLPIPRSIYCQLWNSNDYKKFKDKKWIQTDTFIQLRQGDDLIMEQFIDDPFYEEFRHHNTIGRDNDNTLQSGGLFSLKDISFHSSIGKNGGLNGKVVHELDIYYRIQDDKDLENLFIGLFEELSIVGFGADSGTGRGQFEIIEHSIEITSLNNIPPEANGITVLSTFQPSENDPIDGYWDSFTKFGKVGPDIGLNDVRKKSIILFRSGACFHCDPHLRITGRLIQSDELLPQRTLNYFSESNEPRKNISQYSFGLSIPMCLPIVTE